MKVQDWTVGGAVGGNVKTYGGMTWVEVDKAGHMVVVSCECSENVCFCEFGCLMYRYLMINQ